jgi:hypothetical protein
MTRLFLHLQTLQQKEQKPLLGATHLGPHGFSVMLKSHSSALPSTVGAVRIPPRHPACSVQTCHHPMRRQLGRYATGRGPTCT